MRISFVFRGLQTNRSVVWFDEGKEGQVFLFEKYHVVYKWSVCPKVGMMRGLDFSGAFLWARQEWLGLYMVAPLFRDQGAVLGGGRMRFCISREHRGMAFSTTGS